MNMNVSLTCFLKSETGDVEQMQFLQRYGSISLCLPAFL